MDPLTPIRPPNFRWIVPRLLAGSGRPGRPEHIAFLAREGVRAIVSATPLWEDVEQAARDHGIELLPIPIEDYGVPTDEQIRRFLRYMKEQMSQDKPVLVHCAAGVGRTGTLCSLWLVHEGASAEEALERVGVESPRQVALLRRWEGVRLEDSWG